MSSCQALGYSDFVLRKAVEVQEQAALGWVIRSDQLTRSRMVHYQLGGHTPVKALRKAMAETVQWALQPSSGSLFRS